ncbi:hypothetical protein TEA_022656 [Camellia sinensis var. sinensis]|uniref:alpha-1,2-Mannosidase n=1 Tax=Camellia sinensis var. sinensis TaxID=542762 RepID=A0A4S4DPA5_CAMSN|nr:hypothetical protein TEA_022656 [Camellia sinensis var. sinensis]
MVRCNCGTWILIFLVISPTIFHKSMSELDPRWVAKKRRMSHKVRKMFYHAYDNYMTYAFPHDELKPLAKTFTDSLVELGNLKLEHLPQEYHGSALTLVESLSSLVIMGNNTEFERAVLWLSDNLTFDVDARINLFECNIRVLGGLVSAHILATDSTNSLVIMGNNTEFERAVLWLSENLTFDVDARINLFECNIRVLGGLVSAHILATDSTNRLVQRNYKNQLLILAEDLGRRFLPAFDTPTGLPYAWINLKNHQWCFAFAVVAWFQMFALCSLILEMGALSRLAGDPSFESAALRALRKLWSMRSSLNLLGTTLDVETGEWIEYSSGIGAGVDSFYEYLMKAHILFGRDEFWRMFQPAYLAVQKYFRHGAWYHEADMRTGKATYWQLTSLQAFWPGLQANPWFLEVGETIVDSLNLYTKVESGFASIRDVTTMQWEDHQHSFFLAETCKYLYLLFDDSFLVGRNYIFTTEGHPLPVSKQKAKRASAMSLQVCPATTLKSGHGGHQVESACHILDVRNDHRCLSDEDCGVEASTCRQRSCSIAGYCGRWSLQ